MLVHQDKDSSPVKWPRWAITTDQLNCAYEDTKWAQGKEKKKNSQQDIKHNKALSYDRNINKRTSQQPAG